MGGCEIARPGGQWEAVEEPVGGGAWAPPWEKAASGNRVPSLPQWPLGSSGRRPCVPVHGACPCAGGVPWLCSPDDGQAVPAIRRTLALSLHASAPRVLARPSFLPAPSEASTVPGTVGARSHLLNESDPKIKARHLNLK